MIKLKRRRLMDELIPIMEQEITIETVNLSRFDNLKSAVKDRCSRIKLWISRLNRRQRILAGSGIGLFLMGLVALVAYLAAPSGALSGAAGKISRRENLTSVEINPPETLKDKESPLDGVLITSEEYTKITARRPLAVIVENHVSSRPSAGLNRADLVYECLAEGGITRFMLFYLRGEAEKIGPVRSLRTYFLDWLAEFGDALVMHIGYAPPYPQSAPASDVLAYISRYGVKSLGLASGRNFWRVVGRRSPHNAFTSTKMLWQKAEAKGWLGMLSFDKWKYKDETALDQRPESQEISLNWDGWGENAYSVKWIYDRKENRYLRENGGEKALEEDGQQIWAKNVVIELSVQTLANDSLNHILYQTIGEGEAVIFLDGEAVNGVWRKADRASRTKFYNAEGEEIEFNRGRTWIMVAPTGSEIVY